MDHQEKTVLLKNGKTCIIRRGEERDAEALLNYLKVTAEETRNLTREPEDVDWTLEEERELIREKNDADDVLNLLAFVDGRHAGNCWGMGIGTALLSEVLASARAAGYEQAELEVVSTNTAAIGLYQKLGFEAVGTMPRAVKYKDGTYADLLLMVKRL